MKREGLKISECPHQTLNKREKDWVAANANMRPKEGKGKDLEGEQNGKREVSVEKLKTISQGEGRERERIRPLRTEIRTGECNVLETLLFRQG